MATTRDVSVQKDPAAAGSTLCCFCPTERGFLPCQTTELCDAILEGYPKSKKQFFEEVGIETDEDHNVTLPDP